MSRIATELSGGIFTIRFDNPPHGYLDGEMAGTLAGLLPDLEAAEVRVVVLAGVLDGVFIRHYAVEDLKQLSDALRARNRTFDETSRIDDHAMNRFARGIEALPKPVIAAVNGHAMGGGWELAMACDIRILEDGPYSLGLPEINLGILPGAGGTQRLAQLAGTARALDMILRGRTLSPAAALQAGLGSELVPDARARAHEIATRLAELPSRALGHIKRLVRAARPSPEPENLMLESRLFLDLLVSDEASERMTRFLDGKRDIREI